MTGRISRIGVMMVLFGCSTEDNANLSPLSEWKATESVTDNHVAKKMREESARKQAEAVAGFEALGGNYGRNREKLNLAGSSVTDEDLALIRLMPLIEKLKLDKTQITDEGLDRLAGLAELRSLSLRNTQITDEGLSKLKNIPRLREVRLNGTLITDQGLEHIKALENLEYVGLPLERLTDAAVDDLLEARPDLKLYR